MSEAVAIGRRRATSRAAAGLLWVPLVWQLTPVWSANPAQAYGWGVPLLALYLAAERARHAPPEETMAGGARRAVWMLFVAALAILPLALTLLEADPSWPLMQWAAFGAVATATLAGIAIDDGVPRARHFVFPILFFATALSWPSGVTTTLVAALQELNAQLAATAVSSLGHPAVVSGNVIEVSAGFVGIDEACSGVRSLQAVWMAGWFFGELFSFAWPRRVALVAGAAGIAVIGNWMRTTALTWLAATGSPAAAERWHDRVGAFELIGTLAAVALLAGWWARRSGPRADGGRTAPVLGGRAGRTAMAGGLCALAVPALWYGWHEARASGADVRWELVRPAAEWRDYEIPERALTMLQPTSWAGFSRVEPASGVQAFALLVNWSGGTAGALNAEVHDPTQCLPAAGIAMETEPEPVETIIDGVAVRFTVGRFRVSGREQRVYYCHWDAWLGRARGEYDVKAATQLRSWRVERARRGQRRAGAAYLAFVVPVENDDAGAGWLREWAPRLLRRR